MGKESMNVKLIKKNNIWEGVHYILEDDKGWVKASTLTKEKGLSLSLKNCQSIERGYDLDELAKKIFPDVIIEDEDYEHDGIPYQWGFKVGFLKALELMGDKEFSEDEMIGYYEWHKEQGYVSHKSSDMVEYIQSIQKTEWDVEIVMEPYHDGEFADDGDTHIFEAKLRPKLDVDGCMILKIIQ